MINKSKILKKAAVALTAIFLVSGNMFSVSASDVEIKESKETQLTSMFTTLDLMDANILELSKAMENGSLTAEKLVKMYIDRINAYDKSLSLNSIISINPNALSEAKELDKERADGKVKGHLHGIPIIVKDNYDVKSLPTSAGAVALKDSIAPNDAYVIEKLKAEGAIIIGKSNLSEFAFSGSNSRSSLGGTVHNAYDNRRTAAGSSGGTAVAVTSNFAAAGLGTDTGSSIRRPSSFSNLYGLRPSLGLTSRDGVVPLNLDRDVTGPICRSTSDLGLLLDVMAGTDANDSWTKDADSLIPTDGYTSHINSSGLKGKKIGYLSNSFGYYVDSKDNVLTDDKKVELDIKIQGMVDKAKENLKAGGAELVDISSLIPESYISGINKVGYVDVFEYDLNKYLSTLPSNAPCKTLYDIIQTGMGKGYITNLGETTITDISQMIDPRTTNEHKAMIANVEKYRNDISKILKDNGIDAVMFVSQTNVADIEETSNNANNTAAYINKFGPVLGLPEMMIPMGVANTDVANGYTENMPLGMSMFTDYGNESSLLEISSAYEEIAKVRYMPKTLPALMDEDLLKFYDNLEREVASLDESLYTDKSYDDLKKIENSIKGTDMSDPQEVYNASLELAKAYDSLKLNPAVIPEEDDSLLPKETINTSNETVIAETKETNESNKKDTIAKSGDSNNLGFLMVTMILALGVSILNDKKHTKSNKIS